MKCLAVLSILSIILCNCSIIFGQLNIGESKFTNIYYPRSGILCSSAVISGVQTTEVLGVTQANTFPKQLSFDYTALRWDYLHLNNNLSLTLDKKYETTFTRRVQASANTMNTITTCHQGKPFTGKISDLDGKKFNINYTIRDGKAVDDVITTIDTFPEDKNMFKLPPKINIREQATALSIDMKLGKGVKLSDYDALRIHVFQGELSSGFERVKIDNELFTATFNRFSQELVIDLKSGKLPSDKLEITTITFPDGKLLNNEHNGLKVFTFSLFNSKGEETQRGIGSTCDQCSTTLTTAQTYVLLAAAFLALVVLCLTICCINCCCNRVKEQYDAVNSIGGRYKPLY